MLPGKKISPAFMLETMRRRVWLLVVPPVITTFAALVYSSTVPNVYESDILVAIDPQRVPDAFVRSTVTMETDRRMDAISVQVLSRTNLERMIKELDLYPQDRPLKPIEDVVAEMRRNLRVDLEFPRPRWGVIPQPTSFHVRFTYPEPDVAAKVTAQLGQLFVEQNTRDRGALAGATSRFLEDQLVEARKKLEAQERRLETYRQQYGRELPTQLQTNLQALSNAQMQAQSLVESIARDNDRKLMLERLYRDALAEPAPVVVNVAQGTDQVRTVSTVRQQLAMAQSTLAGMLLRYKPDHPDVLRTKRQIADLEAKAAAEPPPPDGRSPTIPEASVPDAARRENLRQMRAEIESLDRQTAFKTAEEQRVREEIAEYQRRIDAAPGLESEWISLTRDYDTQQTAYKELLAKSTSAQMAATLEDQDIGERFRIVDEARVPVHPLPSMRLRYNATGLAIGLIFGFGVAALLELRDASYRSASDVLETLSMPVLASVPRVFTSSERARRQRLRLWLGVAGAGCIAVMIYVTWAMALWQSVV